MATTWVEPRLNRILTAQYAASLRKPDPFLLTVLDPHDIRKWYFMVVGLDPPHVKGEFIFMLTAPDNFPEKPPKFEFLTPNGVFTPGGTICISVGEYHANNKPGKEGSYGWRPSLGMQGFAVQVVNGIICFDTLNGGIRIENAPPTRKTKYARDSRAYNKVKFPSVVTLFEQLADNLSPDIEPTRNLRKGRDLSPPMSSHAPTHTAPSRMKIGVPRSIMVGPTLAVANVVHTGPATMPVSPVTPVAPVTPVVAPTTGGQNESAQQDTTTWLMEMMNDAVPQAADEVLSTDGEKRPTGDIMKNKPASNEDPPTSDEGPPVSETKQLMDEFLEGLLSEGEPTDDKTPPLRTGDKMSSRSGNKPIVANVMPPTDPGLVPDKDIAPEVKADKAQQRLIDDLLNNLSLDDEVPALDKGPPATQPMDNPVPEGGGPSAADETPTPANNVSETDVSMDDILKSFLK